MGPHEVAVIINEASRDSETVGEAYIRLRSVPASNVVRLRLPAALTKGQEMSPEEFTRYVWNPTREQLLLQGVSGHILTWAFSCDFPVRITSVPAVSLTGLVFVRNHLPERLQIEKGFYLSPLFAGPHNERSAGFGSQSLDVSQRWVPPGDMPLPAMMLGYTRERGNSVEDVIRCFERSAGADNTMPSGTVYLVTNDDVRSKCRDWQFGPVAGELMRMGRSVAIVANIPVGRKDAIGLMTGAADVKLAGDFRMLPGSMAEHLTSLAAVFDSPLQTKLTAWIGAGASASAGTVTEPMSNWMKFPHARFFVHYAAGCTMIESLYQSVRCPLQLLLVGDPLVAPYAPSFRVRVTASMLVPWFGDATVRAECTTPPGLEVKRYLWLMDGLAIGAGREVKIDTRKLGNGSHRLRVVAHSIGMVNHQAFDERQVNIENDK
jgi:hypothetical protein